MGNLGPSVCQTCIQQHPVQSHHRLSRFSTSKIAVVIFDGYFSATEPAVVLFVVTYIVQQQLLRMGQCDLCNSMPFRTPAFSSTFLSMGHSLCKQEQQLL